jgi:tetratricopeptide (TPR) repeat protein
MGSICYHVTVDQLYADGAAAWKRYVEEGRKLSDLNEAIEKCNTALSEVTAQETHTLRNVTSRLLIFALLEQKLDQSSLENIETHFSKLEGWGELRKVDARAIAERLASRYHELYQQTQTPSDFQRCLSSYNRADKYSDTLQHRAEVNLKMVDLYGQVGRLEEALKAIETAKSTCPTDRRDLLSSIFIKKLMIHQEIYRSTGSPQELRNTVAEVEGALQTLPLPQRAILLTGVAQSITALYGDQPPEVDLAWRLRDAIAYARESVGLNVGEQGPQIQANLALADALSSSHAKPTTQELDEAIGLYWEATDSEAFRGDWSVLARLANAMNARCEKEEDPQNGKTFQSAIELYEEALIASDDNWWNSRIANNIACIYVNKANNTHAEVFYMKARENYLKAAGYLSAIGTDSSDRGLRYYTAQAEVCSETITQLGRLYGVSHENLMRLALLERKLTPKRRPTGRASL